MVIRKKIMFQLLTQDKDFFPTVLSDKFQAIREMGFDGFEIDGKLLLDRFDFADNHRFEPGSGQLNFKAVLDKLKAINYSGAIAFECRVIGTPASDAYRASVEYIRSLMDDLNL